MHLEITLRKVRMNIRLALGKQVEKPWKSFLAILHKDRWETDRRPREIDPLVLSLLNPLANIRQVHTVNPSPARLLGPCKQCNMVTRKWIVGESFINRVLLETTLQPHWLDGRLLPQVSNALVIKVFLRPACMSTVTLPSVQLPLRKCLKAVGKCLTVLRLYPPLLLLDKKLTCIRLLPPRKGGGICRTSPLQVATTPAKKVACLLLPNEEAPNVLPHRLRRTVGVAAKNLPPNLMTRW